MLFHLIVITPSFGDYAAAEINSEAGRGKMKTYINGFMFELFSNNEL